MRQYSVIQRSRWKSSCTQSHGSDANGVRKKRPSVLTRLKLLIRQSAGCFWNASFVYLFIFVGTHFGIFVRVFLVHFANGVRISSKASATAGNAVVNCVVVWEVQGLMIRGVFQLGWTPLHHASAGGHVPVVTHLNQAGAEANSKNRVSGTAQGETAEIETTEIETTEMRFAALRSTRYYKKGEFKGSFHCSPSRSSNVNIYPSKTLYIINVAIVDCSKRSERFWHDSWLMNEGRLDWTCAQVSRNDSHISVWLGEGRGKSR